MVIMFKTWLTYFCFLSVDDKKPKEQKKKVLSGEKTKEAPKKADNEQSEDNKEGPGELTDSLAKLELKPKASGDITA